MEIDLVNNGTVTTPKGFCSGAVYSGLKEKQEDNLDLGILFSDKICKVAGTFTTNKVRSPSVDVSEAHIASGEAHGIVANSGCANCCVGPQGRKDAEEMVSYVAKKVGVSKEEILICSTGIIGLELPIGLMKSGIDEIELTDDGGHDLAKAILTTDSRTKECALSVTTDDGEVLLGGISKGSGMIHPDMATMLCFVTTDADVELSFLRKCIKEAVDVSFNMLSIDGDTSTNDSVIILSNGAAGGSLIKEGSKAGEIFQTALRQICMTLAMEIARDGEGATKLIEVTVEGATNLAEAKKAAKAVVSSSLVKSAIHGSDPNWGRIMATIGRSGADVNESIVDLYINDVCIMESGRPVPFFKNSIVAALSGPKISIRINLYLGDGTATAWGCDLSEEYVTFNSAYVT